MSTEHANIEPLAASRAAPIASQGGWHLIRGQDWAALTERERTLADLLVELFPSAVAAAQTLHQLPAGKAAYVVLGGDQDAGHWCVDVAALGFHAVAAQKWDSETDEDYFDVNEHHDAVVNLAALARAIDDDVPDRASIEAALVTMPHEMAHVLEWMRASSGRTPLQVFDGFDGEHGLRTMRAAIESQAVGRNGEASVHGHAEDEAEDFGRGVVDRLVADTGGFSAAWGAADATFCRRVRESGRSAP